MLRFGLLASLLVLPAFALAQETPGLHDMTQHGAHAASMAHGAGGPAMIGGVAEPGQSAFAAIAEIVANLMADPATDWSRVDLEALRQHLIDMDNVTLRARVDVEEIDGGARLAATSNVPDVAASIRAMVSAHAETVDGMEGWTMRAADIPGGAALTVTGPDPDRIRGLGFIGLLAVGMHHQQHHWAIATGQNPHAP